MDSIANKVQKHVAAITAKTAKQQAEIQRLKEQLATAKAMNTRIRRIAKRQPDGPVPAAPVVE
jgi:hypothetical protein